MEKYITWYRFLMKAWAKKKSSWIQLVGMVLVILLIIGTQLPDANNTVIGICNQDGEFVEDVIEKLENKESVFQFKRYEEPEKLREAVVEGKVESGFIFEEGLEEKLEKSRKNKLITCISTPLTTKSAVARETVFVAFLERYSEDILLEQEEQVFGKGSSEISEMLLEKNQEYLNGDKIFRMDFEEVESSGKVQEQKSETFPVRGMIALLIFIMILMEHGRKFEQKACAVEKALTTREKMCFEFIRYLASATIPALVGICLLVYAGNGAGILKEVVGMLLMVVISALWMVLVGKLFRNSITYASWIMTIVVANVLLCPVFFDLSEYLPAIRYVNCIFPVGIYLKWFTI